MTQDKVVSLEFGSRQPSVRIHLLGTMRATSYLGESLIPRGKKARAIFGYLCLLPGQRIPRSRLAAMLWDRVPEQQARTSLRQALRELSLAMGPLAEELIKVDAEAVRLDPRACWIDASALLSGPHPADLLRGDLATLCSGELLEDLIGITLAYDQWLLAERARFTSKLTQLLEAELQQITQAGISADRRAALARRVIAFDPTHEGASRILMRALADLGERAQALREFERCRTALRASLDADPSAETQELYQLIKAVPSVQKARENVGNASPLAIPYTERIQLSSPPNRLRVGVLPFLGSGSADAEITALSLSQEIAAALARFRWFDVIAPLSISRDSLCIHNCSAGPEQWHYIVDGTLANKRNHFHISVRLLDINRDIKPVWSDHFELSDGTLDQIYERVVAPVVARIDPVILYIEGQPSRPPRSGATSLVLQALPMMYALGRDKYEEAGRLIKSALEADPKNAKALAWQAYWYVWYIGQNWSQHPLNDRKKAQELALKAIKADPESAEALVVYAHICSFLEKDFKSAIYYFERALKMNPNFALVWAISAPTCCYIGQPSRALEHLDRYRELAPFDPNFHFWETIYVMTYFFLRDYEKAVQIGKRATKLNPDFSNGYKPMIASLGYLDRRDEAAPYIEKLLSLEPNFTIERFGKTYPFQRDEDRQHYMRGLELAGVPLA